MSFPGIVAITMPKWGIEMQEGTVTDWHVSEGQQVAKDAPLVDVETDKIVNTVESPTAGLIRRILAPIGEARAVGALIAVCAEMTVPDADIDAFIAGFRPPETSFEPSSTGTPAAAPASGVATAPAPAAPAVGDNGEVNVSPIARRLAEKLGLDLSRIQGTGPNGRISKEDVEQAAAAGSANRPAPVVSGKPSTRTRLSATRLAIARRLLESKQSIPHYRLETSIDASSILARRTALKAAGTPVTVNDFIVRACALALAEHATLNAHLVGDELVTFNQADICVAVSTDSGLMTPVVRQAAAKSLLEIGAAVTDLAARARAGSLRREDVADGTFTVSNLGMYGLDRFDAIINPPQVAILAVGAARDRVIVVDGAPAARPLMSLTLSCDHRVVDGAMGAGFLATLKARLEAADSL